MPPIISKIKFNKKKFCLKELSSVFLVTLLWLQIVARQLSSVREHVPGSYLCQLSSLLQF